MYQMKKVVSESGNEESPKTAKCTGEQLSINIRNPPRQGDGDVVSMVTSSRITQL